MNDPGFSNPSRVLQQTIYSRAPDKPRRSDLHAVSEALVLVQPWPCATGVSAQGCSSSFVGEAGALRIDIELTKTVGFPHPPPPQQQQEPPHPLLISPPTPRRSFITSSFERRSSYYTSSPRWKDGHNGSCGGARESFKGSLPLPPRRIELLQITGCRRVCPQHRYRTMDSALTQLATDEEYRPSPPLHDTMPPNVLPNIQIILAGNVLY